MRVWPPRRRLPEAETGGGYQFSPPRDVPCASGPEARRWMPEARDGHLLKNELADDHQQRRGRRQRTDGESNIA